MASSKYNHLHFVMVPYLSPGRIIPMIDMAKVVAQQGVTVTIVTTSANVLRFQPSLDRAIESGWPISFLELQFPSLEVGLPEGCENVDVLPGLDSVKGFRIGIDMLQTPLEQCFPGLNPSPSCIISDNSVAWTADTAKKFQIPRIIFDGMSCFNQLCTHSLRESRVYESVTEKSQPFVIPGLPDRIELTKVQLPRAFNQGALVMSEYEERIREAELGAYGVIMNTLEELEQEYANGYKKLRGDRVWCVGPLSLCSKDVMEKAQRGSKPSTEVQECLKWLESKAPGSVVYACLGSISRIATAQLKELALGLEASKHPFVWVARAGDKTKEVENWIDEDGFEERNKGRGLVIRGWAPQVLILSHPAIGAFLTHCGWNSTLEGICAGVPMITWPQFADQFFNEKLIVQVTGTGVSVGAKEVVQWGEEQKVEVKVKSEQFKMAIEKAMNEGIEGEARRKRTQELGKMANEAFKEGGSSHRNLTLLIEDILEKALTLEKHHKLAISKNRVILRQLRLDPMMAALSELGSMHESSTKESCAGE